MARDHAYSRAFLWKRRKPKLRKIKCLLEPAGTSPGASCHFLVSPHICPLFWGPGLSHLAVESPFSGQHGALHISSVQSLSRVLLFETPWIAARQASLSITNSRSLPKLMSIESVMPSSHLILCCPLLLLPPVPPSIRVFCSIRIYWINGWLYWIECSLLPTQLPTGQEWERGPRGEDR